MELRPVIQCRGGGKNCDAPVQCLKTSQPPDAPGLRNTGRFAEHAADLTTLPRGTKTDHGIKRYFVEEFLKRALMAIKYPM